METVSNIFGFITLLVLVLIIFISWYNFLFPKEEDNPEKYKELLRFFPPEAKLRVPEVAEIIKARTEGRRDLSDSYLYKAFRVLCDNGLLCREEELVSYEKRQLKRIRYFLPEAKQ